MEQYIFYGDLREYIVGRRAEQYVHEIGGKLLGYCDSNPDKWDDLKRVYSPDYIMNYPRAIIVILCAAVKNVEDFLRRKGIQNRILAYPHFRYTFLYGKGLDDNFYSRKWIMDNRQKLWDIYELKDELTHRILLESISQRQITEFCFVETKRMYGFEYLPYFRDDELIPIEDITLIDCGAYIGDSIEEIYEKFREHIKVVYAYEPSAENMRRVYMTLKKIGLERKSVCYQKCTYDSNGMVGFSLENMISSHINEKNEIQVNACKIDDTIKNVEGKICIKMDIEGAELYALKGARETIKKYNPYMVICVYHKVEDILDIPRFILKVNENYKFYLRSGCHLECYAIPTKCYR